ncbi:hypothetical protein ATCC90586_000645 [Pythium insidiosum]|nr:hypothetical protein ATCC90586_000645 [Pythium insidiosum]
MAAPEVKSCLDAQQSVLRDIDFTDCMLRSGLHVPVQASAGGGAIRSACDVPNCEDLATRLAHADLLSCSIEPFASMEFVAKSCHFRLQPEEPEPKLAVAPRGFQMRRFLARINRTSSSSRSSRSGSKDNVKPGSDVTKPTKTNDGNKSSSPVRIIIGVVAGVVVILLLVWYVRRRQRRDRKSATDPGPTEKATPFPDHTLTTELLSKTHGTTHTSSTQASSATISSHSEEVTVHRQAFHATATSALSDPELSQMRVSMLELLVGEKISHGAFGEVFLGEYRNVPVAIKRLSPQHRHDIKQLRSFLSEAKLTASLHHAHIIGFVGIAWKTPTDVHVVTEYMSGGDLRSLLSMYQQQNRANGFNQHKLRIALHIVDALVYLHSRQPPVLHRDLKSRNVLLSTQHDAKLIDFGVSREREDLTMTAGVGTLRWMAPEVMQGGRYSDKADIFSFGVLLSELDTHRIPYNVDGAPMNDLVIITQVSMGHLKVDFSPEADNKIVRLARACMAMEATERPSAEQVLQILASFVEGDTIYAI